MTFFENVWLGILSSSLWEWLAVLSSIIYVILAAKKKMLCWLFAIITSALYFYICFVSQLYVETILQVFYLSMAIFGWHSWRKSKDIIGDIKKWGVSKHLINLSFSALLSLLLGLVFDHFTDHPSPYIDAFTTCFSIAATYMVTQKIIENWLYWIVIDVISIYLYTSRGLQLTAVLFMLFAILAVVGYFSWRVEFKKQTA